MADQHGSRMRNNRPVGSRRLAAAAGAVVVVHLGLLAWSAANDSPVWDEVGHLVAGISHWQFGTFDLYRVNPPLVRAVAALPVLFARPETDWSLYDSTVGARSERNIRGRFVEVNGDRIFALHTYARWACLPFSLLGACVSFRWARELYGETAGLLALVLWCFDPNVLGYGHVITPDLGAAACGVAAAYLFWRWLKGPRWTGALVAGLALGLAELAKSTWIVLFALWPLVWFLWRWSLRREQPPFGWRRQAGQIAAILGLALYLLNLGYGFEGSFRKLGDYGFVSRTLGGSEEGVHLGRKAGNRFAGTWMGAIPLPLPANYVQGIDLQKSDFERKMLSYLGGRWKLGGWWYYYLYALAVKVPLGTWGLLFLALLVRLRRRRDGAVGWRDEVLVLGPLLAVLALVSSQTGFNHHVRYVLPIFPFAFVWASGAARDRQAAGRWSRRLGGLLLAWSVGSSLWIYPHSISYFNELVGGPRGGHAHLGGINVDSNIDCGQDLLYLRRWLEEHPEARPYSLAFNGVYEAKVAGLFYERTPTGPGTHSVAARAGTATGPLAGWHAVSVNRIRSRDKEYEYFLRFQPVAMAGYSIYIYHISLEQADRVRRELGLPGLPSEMPRGKGQ